MTDQRLIEDTYPGPRDTIAEARRHILEAHANR
jgi:hypothetical protein